MVKDITHDSTSKIISTWNTVRPYCTGALISGSSAYSLTRGRVIDVGVNPANLTTSVTVRVNLCEWLRYCNLQSASVKLDDIISAGQLVGPCKGGVLFEYCTNWWNNSPWSVNVGNEKFYKQNPVDIINDRYVVSYRYDSITIRNEPPAFKNKVNEGLTPAQIKEFSNSRCTDVEF